MQLMGRQCDMGIRLHQIKAFFSWMVRAGIIVFLFYRSVLLFLILGIPIGIYGFCTEKRREMVRWRKQMNIEFREGLQGIAAALQAGYSMENALQEAAKDLQLLYGEQSVLLPQLQDMVCKLQLNQPLESVFDEFAEYTQVEDIAGYAGILHTTKRIGGDLIAITRMTADRISEKMEVKREIDSIIAGKQMEAKVMQKIPPGIILYFWICSPGFTDVLYQGGGRVIMTVLLAVYLLAYYWTDRICQISI
ncbi:MAG: type II secretion system F family protein [Lachnospiraceae bacterium]|nr:type II secretion system F family protein [Lachnospiraceae bacterium]